LEPSKSVPATRTICLNSLDITRTGKPLSQNESGIKPSPSFFNQRSLLGRACRERLAFASHQGSGHPIAAMGSAEGKVRHVSVSLIVIATTV